MPATAPQTGNHMTHADIERPSSGKPWNSPLAREHPLAFLGLSGVAGFIAACAVVWFLVVIANLFPEKTWISQMDDSVTNWLMIRGSDGSDKMFALISLLGGWALLAVVVTAVAAFALRRDGRRAVTVAVTCAGAVLLNAALKAMFLAMRPVSATEFTTAAQSWNFPSGHAISALVSYGILSYLFIESVRSSRTRTIVAVVAVALIALIGFTRIYLGVHSLSDVVTGYAAGGVWLAICIAGYRWARRNEIGFGRDARGADLAPAS